MAVVKYRVDGRKSNSYCSTVSIVVFTGLCLVGVWMLMSSSVIPVQNADVSSQKGINEFEEKVSVKNSIPFEDETNAEDSSKNEENVNNSENTAEESSNEKPIKENEEGKIENESDGSEVKTEESSNEKPDSNSNESDGSENKTEESDSNSNEETKSEKSENENIEDINHEDDSKTEEKIEENQDQGSESIDILPTGAQSEILTEATTKKGAWSTQATESENEKKSQKSSDDVAHKWKICKVTAGPDYIPCLDNVKVIRKLPSTAHYEHRERHCPDEAPTCVVSLPEGYKKSIKWPTSREKIWYYNVPHPKLAAVKGHQNWVKVSGEYLTFPGGGTQFKNGALHYIDFLQKSLPKLAWGKRTRVVLDVGCGVASFGGYLFERDVIAMSFAPKDEHEAQVQFALERGIPAISAVMGTTRLPYPSKVFDAIHCARCRVPWHIEGGKLLLELNRLLRPGGYFVWSATPVYRKDPEDSGIWTAMSELTKSMCWDLVAVKKDKLNEVGAAFYRKPTSNECYEKRAKNQPPLCNDSDDPDAAWNVTLDACIHKVPTGSKQRTTQWPEEWPLRAEKAPSWLKSSEVGVYGKAAPEDFAEDYKHWKHVISMSYMNGMGISWSSVRNVMDMKAVYGGFAAALKELNIWVMNIVPITSPDTLPLIYDRGFIGIYHDWCESFSTYPRTYDLLHADHLFSDIKKRCKILSVFAEVDRILRPEGHFIIRDKVDIVSEIENFAKSLQWKIRSTYSKDNEALLCVQKTFWRPTEEQTIASAIE